MALIGLCALVLTGSAQAYTCPTTTIDERIEAADVVFVGRSTGSRAVPGDGVPQRVYTFAVDQDVKGSVGGTVDVRIPVRAVNGGQVIPRDVAAGILASPVDGTLFTTRCGVTDPGAVLAAVDEPRGNAIRLTFGVVFLLAVLGYSIRRLRRRTLPG